jgi:putative ABC transport system permease protein
LLGPLLARFNFPLKLTFQPRSLILAYCLGVIFTFVSVALSSWLVSRMTVIEAMRDLPEPAHAPLPLGELGVRFIGLMGQLGWSVTGRGQGMGKTRGRVPEGLHKGFLLLDTNSSARLRRIRRILLEQFPDLLVGFIRALVQLGFLPLLVGYWSMQQGLENAQIIPFSLGLSLIMIGAGLLVQAVIGLVYQIVMYWLRSEVPAFLRTTRRTITTLIGIALVAYWALPFDVLANLGLPRFQGGIEVFFVAGSMMVLGTAWALMTNADLIVRPLLALCSGLSGLYAVTKLASAYPLHRRFRTGLSIIMFSLVVFVMTVMAVITQAMQNNYVDINTQTGGYDIQATAYFQPLPGSDIRSTLAQHGIDPNAFSAIGVQKTSVVGVLQPSADMPRWYLYPVQVVSGGFLQGYGLHLVARARGFNSDSAVWQALQSHPEYALIDSSALPFNPNVITNAPVYDPNAPTAAAAEAPATPPNFPAQYTFSMSGIYQGDTSFPATPVWIAGVQERKAVKLLIIGVVDNSDSAHFGLYIPRSAYSANSLSTDLQPFLPDNSGYYGTQTYYFKVAPGQDKRGLALALGSAFLDYGLETTVLEDAIWQVRGPRILLSEVLLGVVGLTLLLGVAALAITGTRAVIERRQQIGMLRALGCKRLLIQGAFLLESFLVGALGSILGVILGLILAYNIFAVNFFEQFNIGLTFAIPWNLLAIIVGAALLATFVGSLLPAWQAGKVAPAEALRYQ